MRTRKEFRVHEKGSLQGHYILATSKKEAIGIMTQSPSMYSPQNLVANVWKTTPKGGYYPTKLSLFAQKKMGLLK